MAINLRDWYEKNRTVQTKPVKTTQRDDSFIDRTTPLAGRFLTGIARSGEGVIRLGASLLATPFTGAGERQRKAAAEFVREPFKSDERGIPTGMSLGEQASRVLPRNPIRGLSLGVAEIGGDPTNLALGTGSVLSRVGSRAPSIIESIVGVAKPKVSPAVRNVMSALQEAKPLRKGQELLYSIERGRRLERAKGIRAGLGGESGFFSEKSVLGGELPKVQFESIRGKVGQEDIDGLFNQVKSTNLIDEWDKFAAQEGLSKILGETGGKVPTRNEIDLLEKVFGRTFTKTVLEKRTTLQKALEAGGQLANIPRSVMSSFDLSAPLRQGVFFSGRLKQFVPAFIKMFREFGSEKAFTELSQEIASRPTYELMRKSGLAIMDIGSTLTNREERFMSSWAEKIPLVGKIIRASGRGYTGFLNKLRADVFDDLVKKASVLKQDSPDVIDNISKFVNAGTGRGSPELLGLKMPVLERAAVAMNSVFFSPRLMASRINLLDPGFYIKLDPFTRKEALKSLFTFAATAGTVLSLSKLAGADVGLDPKSADFGKIKIGRTRLDILGGFQQYIKLASQLISGEVVSSKTGKTIKLGEGYRPLERKDVLYRFVETKEAPILSFATQLLSSRNISGEPVEIPKEIGLRFTPMVIQDMYDAVDEWGVAGIPLSIPAIFGVGVQTY